MAEFQSAPLETPPPMQGGRSIFVPELGRNVVIEPGLSNDAISHHIDSLISQHKAGLVEIDKPFTLKATQPKPSVRRRVGMGFEAAAGGLKEFTAPNIPFRSGGVIQGLSSLIPTRPTEVGQMAGSLIGGAVGNIPGAIIGGGLGRMGGSVFEGEEAPGAGELAGQGLLGGALGMIPTLVKKSGNILAQGVGRAGEQRVVKGSLNYLSSLLPKAAPKLSDKISVLQKQVSKGTNESLLSWGKNNYNDAIELIKAEAGSVPVTRLSVAGSKGKEFTVGEVIERIEKMGTQIDHARLARSPRETDLLLKRDQMINDLNGWLENMGHGNIAKAYGAARNEYARVQEVVRLLTSGKGRPLDLTAGKIDLAKLQKQFLQHREAGKLSAFKPGEVDALERSLGRGFPLAGTDIPADMRSLISLGILSRGGPGIMAAGTPTTLPRAAGMHYIPPGNIAQALIPMLLSRSPEILGVEE